MGVPILSFKSTFNSSLKLGYLNKMKQLISDETKFKSVYIFDEQNFT